MNRLTQLDTNFNFYHFGWRSDVDKAITNNFNVDANTGKMSPSVQWVIPEQSEWKMSDEYQQREIVKMCLFFDALQDYDNCGKPVKLTMLEQMQVLKAQAQNFIVNFNKVLCHYGLGQITSNPIIELDSYSHKDRMIVCKVCFDLDFIAECPEVLDISSFPDDLEVCDLENYCDCIQVQPPSEVPILYSFLLDGVNEYLRMPLLPAYDAIVKESPFSFSLWVKPNNVSGNFALFSRYNSSNSYGVEMIIRSGNLRFRIGRTGTQNFTNLHIETTSLPISVGNWYHVLYTYDGSQDAAGAKIYVNGVQQSTAITFNALSGVGDIAPATTNWQVGGQQLVATLNGYVGVFRLWTVELSPSEVLEEYNSGVMKPTAVQEASLLINPDFNNATYSGQWFIPDLTGIAGNYESINMEELDRTTDVPS